MAGSLSSTHPTRLSNLSYLDSTVALSKLLPDASTSSDAIFSATAAAVSKLSGHNSIAAAVATNSLSVALPAILGAFSSAWPGFEAR
jgi:hypothetical protein